MKNVGKKQKNFDLDVQTGIEGENLVLSALNGVKKVEVKTDRIAYHTKRFAIEYEYKGKPSGISTTEADYWAFVIPQTGSIIFTRTDTLKQLCRKCYAMGYNTVGGDNNASKIVLVPIWMLTQENK